MANELKTMLIFIVPRSIKTIMQKSGVTEDAALTML